MYYEINVSKPRQHIVATAPRSITTKAELKALLPRFRAAFPESEGFTIDVTYWEQSGRKVDLNELEGGAS